MKIFNLPDLGEGLPDAEIVEWHVQPGDQVDEGQTLVSVETAKAIIDIPSPQSGRIGRVYGKENDVIQTGKPLLAFGESEDFAEQPAQEEARAADSGTVVGEMESNEAVIAEQAIGLQHSANTVKATPAVRALANRMKVELSMVTPSGHDGLILVEDVRRVARILAEHGPMEPLRGVRRAMARNMTQAHEEVAPASLVEDADITALESRSAITPRLVRALIAACKAEPSLNAWYDSLAVDSPQGLFVANMPDIQDDDEAGIVERLKSLKQKIQNRELKPEQMRGHSIILSNYGAIAGRYASPVVLPPTVAIMGAGKSRDEVVARDGEMVIRHILPLALTFDHRVVTGGEAARFMKAVVDDLEKT